MRVLKYMVWRYRSVSAEWSIASGSYWDAMRGLYVIRFDYTLSGWLAQGSFYILRKLLWLYD